MFFRSNYIITFEKNPILYERYEIIDQEGKICTVEEREDYK